MNEKLVIQIQAYLDGELSVEARLQLLARLEKDPEARELCDSLKAEQSLLKGVGESGHELPVAHSYFWKAISDEIQPHPTSSNQAMHKQTTVAFQRWSAWLVPGGVIACIALVMFQKGVFDDVLDGIESTGKKAARIAPSFHEIDSQQQNAGFISFRSESEGVSVVWISNY